MADAAAELEPAFLMFGAQASQPGQLGVHAGLFNDERVAGRDGFDFGEGEGGAVNVLDAPQVALPRHHLPDEADLGFEGLPHIGVEGLFGDIAEDLHLGVGVVLAQDAALALLNVGGTPRGVEVTQGDQALLDVGPRAHLLAAPEKNPHLPGADVLEHLQFGVVAIMVLDELDFGRGDTARDQFVPHVFIDGKPPSAGGNGQIAKDKLGGTVMGGLPPNAFDLGDGPVDFAVRVVGEGRVVQPEIERRFASVGGDHEHVVLAWIHVAGLQCLGAFDERLDDPGQLRRTGCADHRRFAAAQFRHGEAEHVLGLDVGDLPELLHEFGNIDEAGEAGVEAVYARHHHARTRL